MAFEEIALNTSAKKLEAIANMPIDDVPIAESENLVKSGGVKSAIDAGGGSGGTSNYEDLTNKPKINGVELSGDKSSDDLKVVSQEYVNDNFEKKDGTYELIEAFKIEGEAKAFTREEEPNGKPYNFKQVAVKIKSPASVLSRYGGIYVYTKQGQFFNTLFEENSNKGKEYIAFFQPENGFLTSKYVYSIFKSGFMKAEETFTIQKSPIVEVRTNFLLSVGTEIEIWAVRE